MLRLIPSLFLFACVDGYGDPNGSDPCTTGSLVQDPEQDILVLFPPIRAIDELEGNWEGTMVYGTVLGYDDALLDVDIAWLEDDPIVVYQDVDDQCAHDGYVSVPVLVDIETDDDVLTQEVEGRFDMETEEAGLFASEIPPLSGLGDPDDSTDAAGLTLRMALTGNNVMLFELGDDAAVANAVLYKTIGRR